MPAPHLNPRAIYLRLSILALILSLLLTVIAVAWKAQTIETHLTQQARQALFQANLASLNINFDGRDGWISGLIPDGKVLEQIQQSLTSVPGVRVIHDQTTLAPSQTRPAESSVPVASQPLQAGLYTPSRRHILEQFDLSTLHFNPSQPGLDEAARTTLQQLAELIKQYSNAVIEISAHTDHRGTVLGQAASTQAQAEAVVQYLHNQGIALEKLVAQGYGATRPLVSTEDPTARLRNRRVELTVLKE